MSHVHIYSNYDNNRVEWGLSVGGRQLGVLGVEGEALAEVVLHGTVHVLDDAFQVVTFVGVRLETMVSAIEHYYPS